MIKEYTIKSSSKKDDYSVVLYFDEGLIVPEKCSCTCAHGSFYRFTQANLAIGKWACSHIKEAMKKHSAGEIDNIELERRENGKRDPKPIYPIFQ